jgi:hypothetical protein
LIRTFFIEQWSLLVLSGGGFFKPAEKRILKEIVPPRDFQWADPFITEWDGKTYIFVEQQYKHENGTLGYIELFADLSYSAFTPILEKPYHLSFPNVFRYENQWYMIPESHENRTIDLYKAKNFPDEWELETTLMRGVDAVDSVVFFYGANYWLFTSVAGPSLNDNLHLFYADAFPSCEWTPHPQNPICKGLTNSRMAGAVFCDSDSGKIYRAAQNCLKDYGKETNVNEILELTTTVYKERIIKTISPEKEKKAVCTHTLNFGDKYTVRDIKTRVPRIS